MTDISPDDDVTGEVVRAGDDEATEEADAASPTLNDQPWADETGDRTEAMPMSDLGDAEQPADESASEFRFSFDDERS